MNNKILRASLVSILTGIISSLISIICTYNMAKGTLEWTIDMGTTIFWINTIISFILFICTGIYCFRDMTKKEIGKFAFIVSSYYLIVIGVEQLLLVNGYYPMILLFLFVPVNVYSGLHTILLHTTNLNIFIIIVLSIFMPFLYTLFGRKENINF